MPSGPDVVGGPDAAMVQWMIGLLRAAEDVSATQLMSALMEQGFGALVDFLRALSGARGAVGAEWLSELIKQAADLGWRFFLDNVRDGDEAPDLPTATFLSLVENLLGAEQVNRRLLEATQEGLSAIVIGARLVEVGVVAGTGKPVIVDFDAEAMIGWIGLDHVRAALDSPQLPGVPDERETSWAGRRRHAAAALRAAVAAERRLPSLPSGWPSRWSTARACCELLDPRYPICGSQWPS
jgi:hypothetical protein